MLYNWKLLPASEPDGKRRACYPNHHRDSRLIAFWSTIPYISLQLWQGTDDEIYAVMKDGSRIKLDLTGADATILQAETPIVLSQLDYILLEDGTQIFAPNIQ